jgi:hypothetical protein
MDREKQEEAVRKLIKITKSGKPVVVVYSNPNTILQRLFKPVRFLRDLLKGQPQELYFFRHPLEWWDRFSDVGEVRLYPWRSFHAKYLKAFFPNNFLGEWMLRVLFSLENRFPQFFIKHFDYLIVVITKK